MPFRGAAVTRPTAALKACVAAVVPSWALCTVQVVLPVPLAAVTTMISESILIRNVVGRPLIGNGVEEFTVIDVADVVAMADARVVLKAALAKSVAVT